MPPRRKIRWKRHLSWGVFNLLAIGGLLIFLAFLFWPVVIVVLGISIYGWRTLACHRRLLEEGAEAHAFVTRKLPPPAQVPAPRVDYVFVVPGGYTIRKWTVDWTWTLSEGSQVRVFYDHENPEDHVLECSTFYEVTEDVAPNG